MNQLDLLRAQLRAAVERAEYAEARLRGERNPWGSHALPCKAWAIVTGDGIRRCPITGTMGVFIDLEIARLTEKHHRDSGMEGAELVDVTIVATLPPERR